jgi:SAM-dependent methyltransferase
MNQPAHGTAGTRERYRSHHVEGSRYGFSFGESSRSALFAEWIGRGKVVLDAGCRDGTLLRHYSAGNRVMGCDIDDEALRRCRANVGAPVVHADLLCGLPFAAASVDAVVLGEVLEHLVTPEAVTRDVFRVLRPGGTFVGSVPNGYRLRNRLVFLAGRRFDPDPTHLHLFSPGDLVAMLQAAGFLEIRVEFRESRWLSLSPRLFGNTMLWRAVRKS